MTKDEKRCAIMPLRLLSFFIRLEGWDDALQRFA
jgi:hypothetical protein